ncbi:hypothetical protein BDV28DRAFT_158056 [Aspergillus coremiiformis]|uniref:Tubby C-terminal-like domain-containing protein n=1 Tax=Aspergillus coremiiformis TaxID=138285 RepID=A0A5N6Z5N1_9EURO|nr:hypothetical protein BDV28DRAFT_158056 [Aspergillus coremiiformis]
MSFLPMDEKTKGFYPTQHYHYPDPNVPMPPPYTGYQAPVGHPQYPPQPYHTQGPVRSLKVEFTSWTTRHLIINDMGQDSVVYAADLHNRNPQMEFKAGATHAPFATVHMRALKPEMEIRLHGRDLNLRVKTRLKSETTFASLAFPNTFFTWKSTSALKSLDFECVDQNGVAVARFKPQCSLTLRKLGRLEILIPSAANGVAMDELAITGLAFMYYVYLQQTASANVAVSSVVVC